MGNDIGLDLSSISNKYMDLDNNFSNTFSLFQLESKSYRTKQCWPYIDYDIEFVLEIYNV